MVLIACTSACLYQMDGCCTLERAAASGPTDGISACVNFVPKLPSASSSKKDPGRKSEL